MIILENRSSVAWVAALLLVALVGCGRSQDVPTEGEMSVYEAAAKGDYSYVGGYLNGGFDVNTPDEDGRTLVHYAAAGNQIYMLEVLLEEHGANGSVQDLEGKTPLDYAIENNAGEATWYLKEDQGLGN
jgi:ankyrin repeat protein